MARLLEISKCLLKWRTDNSLRQDGSLSWNYLWKNQGNMAIEWPSAGLRKRKNAFRFSPIFLSSFWVILSWITCVMLSFPDYETLLSLTSLPELLIQNTKNYLRFPMPDFRPHLSAWSPADFRQFCLPLLSRNVILPWHVTYRWLNYYLFCWEAHMQVARVVLSIVSSWTWLGAIVNRPWMKLIALFIR